jgi:beta-lactamase regulating signal transducer with metallopeptidase domain
MHETVIAGILPVAHAVAQEAHAAAQELSAAFARFAHASAPLAITALWQGAVVAAGLALCLRLAPRLSAAHRFAVWAGGFGVLLGLQVLPLFLHSAATGEDAIASRAAARPFAIDARWALVIAALWLALALVRAADLALHTLRLRRLWKNARPISADAEGAFAVSAGGRMRASICTTSELDRPSVIGFFAPRILIPDWLSARLTPGEREQVILHECEHLRRRDDWTNLLQKLALVLFPLNPALAWIEHRLCREREMACDEGVVRVTRAPRAYAACLTSMAERRLEKNLARRTAAALSLGAFERRSELAGRVHSLLWRENVLGPVGARVLLSMVGCGLLVGALELARSPQIVAFESAPPAQAQTASLPQTPDSPEHLVRFDRRNAQAFRAMNAVAIMPAAAQRPMRNGVARPEAVAGNPAGLASHEPRQQMTRIERSHFARPETAQGSAMPQQWIVLTTWEQVQTPAAGSGAAADFSANADPDAGAPAQPGNTGTRQIAVTQWILRVYPASAISAPNPNAHAGRNSARPNTNFDSVLHRQAVLPLASGWLVIQL